MKVLVIAEYYPRAGEPGLGIWAHRQTVAVRDQGVDVAGTRPVPPTAAAVRGARG